MRGTRVFVSMLGGKKKHTISHDIQGYTTPNTTFTLKVNDGSDNLTLTSESDGWFEGNFNTAEVTSLRDMLTLITTNTGAPTEIIFGESFYDSSKNAVTNVDGIFKTTGSTGGGSCLEKITGFNEVVSYAYLKTHTFLSNFKEIFSGCKNLVDVGNLNFGSYLQECEDFSFCFRGCRKLFNQYDSNGDSIYANMLYDWSVESATTFNKMFSDCALSTEVDSANPVLSYEPAGDTIMKVISYWSQDNLLSNLISISYLLEDNTGIIDTYNLSGLDTSLIKLMGGTFRGCTGLVKLRGLVGWDFSIVEQMQYMFQNCVNADATGLNFSSMTTSSLKNTSYMFYGCNTTKIKLFAKYLDCSKVTTAANMFQNCVLDLNAFDYGPLCDIMSGIKTASGNHAFQSCTNFSYMFAALYQSQTSLPSWWQDVTNLATYISNSIDLGTNVNTNTINCNYMFNNATIAFNSSNLFSNWSSNFSKVKETSYMFGGTHGTNVYIDVANWSDLDCSNVTNASYMFSGGGQYTGNALGAFPNMYFSSATNLTGMFENANISLGNTVYQTTSGFKFGSSVTNVSRMFKDTTTGSSAEIHFENCDMTGITTWDNFINVQGVTVYYSSAYPPPAAMMADFPDVTWIAV